MFIPRLCSDSLNVELGGIYENDRVQDLIRKKDRSDIKYITWRVENEQKFEIKLMMKCQRY